MLGDSGFRITHVFLGNRARLLLPETDQQVRRQADQRPPHDQEKEIRGGHQQQHRKYEQVHISKKPAVFGITLHVPDGIDMDQKTHAGDDQKHEHGKRID